jgi:hypothetical protein
VGHGPWRRRCGRPTERAVDDIAIVTDADEWVLVQAKKGMQLEKRNPR